MIFDDNNCTTLTMLSGTARIIRNLFLGYHKQSPVLSTD